MCATCSHIVPDEKVTEVDPCDKSPTCIFCDDQNAMWTLSPRRHERNGQPVANACGFETGALTFIVAEERNKNLLIF